MAVNNLFLTFHEKDIYSWYTKFSQYRSYSILALAMQRAYCVGMHAMHVRLTNEHMSLLFLDKQPLPR